MPRRRRLGASRTGECAEVVGGEDRSTKDMGGGNE